MAGWLPFLIVCSGATPEMEVVERNWRRTPQLGGYFSGFAQPPRLDLIKKSLSHFNAEFWLIFSSAPGPFFLFFFLFPFLFVFSQMKFRSRLAEMCIVDPACVNDARHRVVGRLPAAQAAARPLHCGLEHCMGLPRPPILIPEQLGSGTQQDFGLPLTFHMCFVFRPSKSGCPAKTQSMSSMSCTDYCAHSLPPVYQMENHPRPASPISGMTPVALHWSRNSRFATLASAAEPRP